MRLFCTVSALLAGDSSLLPPAGVVVQAFKDRATKGFGEAPAFLPGQWWLSALIPIAVRGAAVAVIASVSRNVTLAAPHAAPAPDA